LIHGIIEKGYADGALGGVKQRILLACLMVAALAVAAGCSGVESSPTPTFTVPGTGGIVGQVMLPNGLPAHHVVGFAVYLFSRENVSEPNEYGVSLQSSIMSCRVSKDGYYMFSNVLAGTYSLVLRSYSGDTPGSVPIISSSGVTVTVFESEVTTAPTLTVGYDYR